MSPKGRYREQAVVCMGPLGGSSAGRSSFDDFIDALSTLGIPEHRSQKSGRKSPTVCRFAIANRHDVPSEERILKPSEQQRTANIEETIRVETELSRIRGSGANGRAAALSDRSNLNGHRNHLRAKSYTPPDSPQFADRISEGFSDSTASLLETGQDLEVGAAWLLGFGLVQFDPRRESSSNAACELHQDRSLSCKRTFPVPAFVLRHSAFVIDSSFGRSLPAAAGHSSLLLPRVLPIPPRLTDSCRPPRSRLAS